VRGIVVNLAVLAQSVERLIRNQEVRSSILRDGTIPVRSYTASRAATLQDPIALALDFASFLRQKGWLPR
jgi:hypothetical protein